MIRLGSLAGYAFDGPRLLAGWTPPSTPGVYAIAYKPEPETRPERYAIIYVGHADDLAEHDLPLRHPRAGCWTERAGSRWKVYIATFEIPGGTRGHREMIVRELVAAYDPHCNTEKYDKAWREEWIGEYTADTGPLASRGPEESG